jgi:hypothetical protein
MEKEESENVKSPLQKLFKKPNEYFAYELIEEPGLIILVYRLLKEHID